MTRRLVVFVVAGKRYALPVERVREVIEWTPPRALGAAAPWLLGVIALRGTLLQVADLTVRLGSQPGSPRRILVFDAPDGPAGLAVDEVDTVFDVADAAITPAPAESAEAVAEIAVVGSDLVLVLDADAILGPKPPPPPRRRRTAQRKQPPSD